MVTIGQITEIDLRFSRDLRDFLWGRFDNDAVPPDCFDILPVLDPVLEIVDSVRSRLTGPVSAWSDGNSRDEEEISLSV
jgi:hypothetical protein